MNPLRVKDLLFRQQGSEHIVFNLLTGKVFSFDASGIDVLLQCDGKRSLFEIAREIDSPPAEVRSFCEHLEQCGLLHFIDPDVTFTLTPFSSLSIEDELATTYNIQFTYAMGDRQFKQQLIQSEELATRYLCAEKHDLLVGLCELFSLHNLDEHTLFFYQPHFVTKNAYRHCLPLFIQEVTETAEKDGRERLEILNVSHEGMKEILKNMGFRESKKVILWNLDLNMLSLSSKLKKNLHYYERKIQRAPITIRPITRDDIPSLVKLYRSLQEKKDIYTICFNNPLIFESLFELDGFDEHMCLLAEKDGKILGYHIWMWKTEKIVEWWISRVDRKNTDASRFGVMDILFSRVLQYLQKKKIDSANLGWNDLADSGLCYYKWKWGGIPSHQFSFMERKI